MPPRSRKAARTKAKPKRPARTKTQIARAPTKAANRVERPSGNQRQASRPPPMVEAIAARDLFWQNVIRQILTSLSVEWLNRHQGPGSLPGAKPAPGAGATPGVEAAEDLFDGRLGILTHAGERIPIAQVFPMPPCGVGTSDESRLLSMAIECSVFQVRTPTGEVFTLPLSEMRGFHALTPELMRALEEAARHEAAAEGEAAPDGPGTPFGFAAFTSMERANRERFRGTGYPQHHPSAPNPHPDE